MNDDVDWDDPALCTQEEAESEIRRLRAEVSQRTAERDQARDALARMTRRATEPRSNVMDQTEAERLLRAHADDTTPVPVLCDEERSAIVFVLGELDRLRAMEQRVQNLVTINEPMTRRVALVILGQPPNDR